MGTGLRLDCRWASPIQSSSSRHRHHHYSCWDSSFKPTIVSSLCSFVGETTCMPSHNLNIFCSLGGALIVERTSVDVGKVNLQNKFFSSSARLFKTSERPQTDEAFPCSASSLENDSLQFSLLMENLNRIEGILVDSDLVRLQREILIQIERMGALKLFHSYLSRTFVTQVDPHPLFPDTEDLSKSLFDLKATSQMYNVVVRSKKKEERKLKRKRVLEKAPEAIVVSLSANAAKEVVNYCDLSATRSSSSNASGRTKIAKNEVKMSMGVKEVADLERTRVKLEEETGRLVSYRRWAEAAGIDEKSLQQRLHYGWLCRDELLKSARSLVVYVAKGYTGMGICFDDLIQAGNMGVMLGAERFDSTRGYKFSTYVQYWIKKSISSLVARHSRGIRIPARMEKMIKQIQKARRALINSDRKYPRENEIAEFTGLSLANVRLANKCSRGIGSIDQKLRGCLNIKLMEIIPDRSVENPEDIIMKQHLRNDIYKLLEDLHPRERQVLLLRYGLGDSRCRSLSEIGEIAHVSKEWIRKIEKTALAKVRKDKIQADMKHYLHL